MSPPEKFPGKHPNSSFQPTGLWAVLDAGYTPENIVDEAIQLNPDNIVIFDAADFGGVPGEVRVIPAEAIPETTLSTHMISMNVVAALIAGDTGAKVCFIGIQPKSVEMGEGLSEEVKQSADVIVQRIKESVV